MTNLNGKVAIVTGAAVGLGRAYAVALAEAGVNLALCDLRDEVHELPGLLGDKGVSVLASQGDVADPDHVRAVVDGAVDALGGIDLSREGLKAKATSTSTAIIPASQRLLSKRSKINSMMRLQKTGS